MFIRDLPCRCRCRQCYTVKNGVQPNTFWDVPQARTVMGCQPLILLWPPDTGVDVEVSSFSFAIRSKTSAQWRASPLDSISITLASSSAMGAVAVRREPETQKHWRPDQSTLNPPHGDFMRMANGTIPQRGQRSPFIGEWH